MTAPFAEFVLARLPAAPARVLEIGCGDGTLALRLANGGHDMLAIDPRAPEGPIFRQVTLEELDVDERFDAIVASLSLHHVADLAGGVDKTARLLRPEGELILSEFARDRFTSPTARWYYHQRQARAALDDAQDPLPEYEEWERQWQSEHADIHAYPALRTELDRRFTQRFFAWTTYLYTYRLDDELEPLERKLVESGALAACGFRYVGVPRET